MPLVACPKCATNLKVPDGPVPAVRCPKCQTVFKPAPPSQPAFEVVDAAPPKPVAPPRPAAPRPAPAAPKSAARPAPKPAAAEADFEPVDDPVPARKKVTARTEFDDDDDRPRSKRRRDDDYDDEDDRPRRKRRDDSDDDDDRPRGRRRSREDDEDDRPRKKKKRRDDEDDDYDFPTRPRGKTGFAAAKLGALLVSVAFWMDVGMYGFFTLLVLILWTGGELTTGLGLVIGPLRFGSWLVGGVGIGFCIAGPAKARGLAIAAAVLAGFHVLFLLLGILQQTGGLSAIDFRDRPLPEARDRSGRSGAVKEAPTITLDEAGLAGIALAAGTCVVPLDFALPGLVYGSKAFGRVVLFFLAAGCELARLILVLLALRSMAEVAKAYPAGEKARLGAVVVSIVCGAAALLALVAAVIVFEGKLTKSAKDVAGATLLLIMLAHSLMMVLPALAALQTSAGFARKAGRG